MKVTKDSPKSPNKEGVLRKKLSLISNQVSL